MLWGAGQWAANFFETVAAVALVLLTGAVAAGAALWILRRAVGLLGDPQEPDEFFQDEIDAERSPSSHPDKAPADRGSSL